MSCLWQFKFLIVYTIALSSICELLVFNILVWSRNTERNYAGRLVGCTIYLFLWVLFNGTPIALLPYYSILCMCKSRITGDVGCSVYFMVSYFYRSRRMRCLIILFYCTINLQRFVLVLLVIFGGLFRLIAIQVVLRTLFLVTPVIFSMVFISRCCFMFTINDSEVFDYEHEHAFLMSSVLFWLTWMRREQKTTNFTCIFVFENIK